MGSLKQIPRQHGHRMLAFVALRSCTKGLERSSSNMKQGHATFAFVLLHFFNALLNIPTTRRGSSVHEIDSLFGCGFTHQLSVDHDHPFQIVV